MKYQVWILIQDDYVWWEKIEFKSLYKALQAYKFFSKRCTCSLTKNDDVILRHYG